MYSRVGCLAQSKDDLIEQLQRQLAEADTHGAQPVSPSAVALPSTPTGSRGVHCMEVSTLSILAISAVLMLATDAA